MSAASAPPPPHPEDCIEIEALSVRTLIGIFPEERQRKQQVLVTLRLVTDTRRPGASDRIEDALDYKRLTKQVIELVEDARFELLEALAEAIAAHVLTHYPVPRVTVRIDKPGALRFARTVAVTITRDRLP